MLTSKQRAQLRKLANPLPTTLQIGKDGITQGVIDQLSDQLECHELVKVRVLENSFLTVRGAQEELCETLHAEPVQCIGTRLVVYRQASDKDKRRIVLEK